ncbi:Putative ubiquinone biosynthesis monooxygenase [Savitreella phatthalungensis]
MAKLSRDVVVVGGGIAGLSFAQAILKSPVSRHLRVSVIEAYPPKLFSSSSPVSNRTVSLTPSSYAFLQRIDGLSMASTQRLQTYTDMHVYDGVSDKEIQFDSGSGIATMAENNNVQSALWESLREKTTADIHTAKVATIERTGDVEAGTARPKITLDNGSVLETALLVGADGINSPVRTFAGIDSRGWDYPHHGVVGTLTHAGDVDYRTAHQRMLPSGPIAFLPLPQEYASLVWSISPIKAAKIKSLSLETVTKLVNAAFRLNHVDLDYVLSLEGDAVIADELAWRLAQPSYSSHAPPLVTSVTGVASFPLRFRHANTYHSLEHRCCLIGDAAHTIHPMAGQGLNCGLGDAETLATLIEEACVLGSDLASVGPHLTRDRYWANARVHGVVDKLHKLYAVESGPLVAARSIGTGLLDSLGFVKRTMMNAAG